MIKTKLAETINKIGSMNNEDLEVFARYISSLQIDRESEREINRAIDLRFSELDKVSAMVEESDIALFEYEDI